MNVRVPYFELISDRYEDFNNKAHKNKLQY